MNADELKNSLPKQTMLEKLHEESRNWLSSIAFWKDEIRFMHRLINDNFVYFLAKDQAGSFNALQTKIRESVETRLNVLKVEVVNHEKRISDHLKYDIDLDFQFFTKEHENIANDIARFQTNYRLVKTELFNQAEEVLKEKDIKKLVA